MPKTYIAISLVPVLKEIVENKMILTNVLDYWLNGDIIREAKKEIDIHREYSSGDAFTSSRGKGMVFIILNPYHAARGVKKWSGVEFELKPNYGEPYMGSADVTTAGDELAFKGYKKIKLTAKMKKQIQKILKDPEEIDRIQNSDTSVRDIERAIR